MTDYLLHILKPQSMSIILITFNDHTGGAGHGDDDGHDDDDDLGWCDDGSTGRSEVGLVPTSLQ